MGLHRRDWFRLAALGLFGARTGFTENARAGDESPSPLKITGLRVTPIALPDPPLLASSGCHGPYFLRNVVELETDAGIVGIGETRGDRDVTVGLERARDRLIGRNAFSYRRLAADLPDLDNAGYTALELACLDACGRATHRRLCDLIGGPVRDSAEFSAYLFYRYAADHPVVLSDPRRLGPAGRGIDDWGEVRSPESMAAMAARFRDRWGFRVFKLKGGVLPPDVELETMRALADRLGPGCPLRIDPNARWKTETAIRIGQGLKGLPLEYYEDPVSGQEAMAEVRKATGLPMSTNMCVTRFSHIPDALRLRPIDVLLCDLHYFGGFAGCLALGPICSAARWQMSQHSNSHAGITMAAMIHIAASVPQLTLPSDTHYPWLADGTDIIEGSSLPIRDGKMAVPSAPGVGVSLDRDKLARAHEVYRKCGMTRRDDASLMKRIDPNWSRDLY
jgi:glucarate dehydratase